MLYYYPSNRLEHLADILSHLLDKNTSSPFETPQILLPHTGLQHWLSLYLAKQQRIMMNVDFPLPTRFVWDLSRNVLGKANVPTQSPYKREVLQWRIFEILSSQENNQDSLASFVTYFNLSQRDTAQMFDVAVRLADVFEQYAVYRPQWLTDWEKGRDPSEFKDIDSDVMGWQKTLWQRLYAQNSNTPVALQHQAEIQLASKANTLPEHIYLFAVGSLPPQFMRFFFVLSQETNVHFLILNPCQIYWGDALTDKQISTLERKNKTVDLQAERDINPLLRNLGQQGKEFIDAVLQQQHVQIDAFESLLTAELTLLQSIQQGILDGERKTTFSEKPSSTNGIDDSICIHACHSPVRELQVLKEVLLQSLKDNSSLQLDEILVLTPNIEDYAPFVETVFSDPLESNLDLPVSISDRRPVESDPDIKSFISVLALANSRFSVEDVFAPLSSDALKQFFALDSDEIERIQQWLSASAVVWGKDLVHKQAVIDASELNDKHTWYAAIQRLAIGMCNPQESFVADGIALADVVEGQQQQVLGKFIDYFDWLMNVETMAKSVNTIEDYLALVTSIIEHYLPKHTRETSFGVGIIERVLGHFYETYQLADVDVALSFSSFHDAFLQSLSLPETKAKYLLGKITFCSMIPMRSVPFKIVAILGLNQDSFPRKSIKSELNLMDLSPRQPGDRSRKNDDRYLFLEAIVSARQKLHLSYQNRNIKDNTKRSPSLVIDELIDVVALDDNLPNIPVISHPLYPFDVSNYRSDNIKRAPNFDKAWFEIASTLNRVASSNNAAASSLEREDVTVTRETSFIQKHTLEATDIIDFYFNPLKKIVLDKYGLRYPYLREHAFEQPFSLSGANKRKLRKELMRLCSQSAEEELFHDLKSLFIDSGDYADLIRLDDYIDLQMALMQKLYSESKPHSCLSETRHINGYELYYNVDIDGEGRVVMHSLNDDISLYDVMKLKINILASSHQLTVQEDGSVSGVVYIARDALKTPDVKYIEVKLSLEACDGFLLALIDTYQSMLTYPRLLHPLIADALFDLMQEGEESGAKIMELWDKISQPKDEVNRIGFADDDCYQFLFSSHPEFDEATLSLYKNSYFRLMVDNA